MINYPLVSQSKIEELSEIKMSTTEKENLKNDILNILAKNEGKEIKSKINIKFLDQINDIDKYFSFKDIIAKKTDIEQKEFLQELLQDLEEMNHLKKIEFLERKFTENMDENSYSELVKLKNELNRD